MIKVEKIESESSDDEFEETHSMPATITPLIIEEEEKIPTPIKIAPKPPAPTPPVSYPRIQIAQNLHSTPQNTITVTPRFQTNTQNSIQSVQLNKPTSMPSSMPTISPKIQTATVAANAVNKSNNSPLPFPLLILNGMGNGVQAGQNGTNLLQKAIPVNNGTNGVPFNSEVSNILKELLDIQKENLQIEKERLQVEKQKLEYERAVGSQLLNMVPMFNEIFQKFKEPEEEEDTKNFEGHPNYNKTQNGVKRPAFDTLALNNSKIFKQAAVSCIRKSIQDSITSHSDDGDSGIVNDSS